MSDLEESTVDQSDPNQSIDSRHQKLKVLVRSYPEYQRLESQLEQLEEISASKCTGAVWRKTATSKNQERKQKFGAAQTKFREATREELLVCLQQMLTACKQASTAVHGRPFFFVAVVNVLEDKVSKSCYNFFILSKNLFVNRPCLPSSTRPLNWFRTWPLWCSHTTRRGRR